MLHTGQVIAGRYRIGKLIGAGGMAEVYAARHLITEHAVAVKVLRPSPDGNRLEASPHLELEAKIDARVGSPHIVHVQDAGIDEATGLAFLVMELLRGATVDRLIKAHPQQRLPVADVLDIAQQVALGLDAAHALSVIHRDLKPENVFVTSSAGVKILDFGIAKILDASSHVTRELRGTPYYMAPEQAKGEAVSPATDIWALGLTVYRALTGRIYWRAANARDARPPLAEVVYEITVAPSAPPSARLAEQGVRVDAPLGFDAWFLRCIERDPRERFVSAGVAVRALEDVFAGASRGVLALDALPTEGVATPTQPTRTYEPGIADSGIASASVPGVALARSPSSRLLWLAVAALALLALAVLAGVLRPRFADSRGSEASAPETASAARTASPTASVPSAPAPSSALPNASLQGALGEPRLAVPPPQLAPGGRLPEGAAPAPGSPPLTKMPAAARVSQPTGRPRHARVTRAPVTVLEAPEAERRSAAAPEAPATPGTDSLYGLTPSRLYGRPRAPAREAPGQPKPALP